MDGQDISLYEMTQKREREKSMATETIHILGPRCRHCSLLKDSWFILKQKYIAWRCLPRGVRQHYKSLWLGDARRVEYGNITQDCCLAMLVTWSSYPPQPMKARVYAQVQGVSVWATAFPARPSSAHTPPSEFMDGGHG